MTDDERALLLAAARAALTESVGGVAAPARPAIDRTAEGVFVTLHLGGELRGCIGQLQLRGDLGQEVARCAVAAGSANPRFEPVAASELARLEIEVSVLGPLQPVNAVGQVKVGRDGLLVEQHGRRGVLLPQVAIEWGWDVETFLAQVCRKAGLPLDAWKHGATLWRFEAEVFAEPAR